MNKKLITILTIIVLLVSMLVPMTVVNAAQSTAKVSLKANKTTINSGTNGGEIEYQVIVECTESMSGVQVNLEIPEGMEMIVPAWKNEIDEFGEPVKNPDGSNKQVADSKPYLNQDIINRNFNEYDFVLDTGVITLTDQNPFKLAKDGKAVIATFKCKIKDTSKKADYEVKIAFAEVQDASSVAMPVETQADKVSVVVSATGLKLNKNATTIKAGSTETLTATVVPADAEDKVVWSSSDTNVATVNNGVVTAKTVGKTTITAKTENGKYSATCEVTVECAHTNTQTVLAKPSTCKEAGHAEYTKCVDCGKILSGSDAPLALAEHTYVLVPEVKAVHTQTELKNGVKEHYKCSVCGKLFDLNKKEVSEEALVIKAEHTVTNVKQLDEEYHEGTCSQCGLVVKEKHLGEPATCTEKAVCDVCKATYGEVDPENHVHTETRDAVEATVEKEGYTGDVYCLDCGKLVEKGTVIPKVVPEEKPTDPTKPETGDNIMIYVSLLAISLVSIVTFSKFKKRK